MFWIPLAMSKWACTYCFGFVFFYFEAEVTFMQDMFLHVSMEHSIEGVP